MMILAIGCAVLAAGCSAIGVRLQYTAVRAETQDTTLRLGGLPKLLRNPLWRTGFAVLAACAVLQILALSMAPVSVVSPIVVLALPIVAVLHARSRGTRLGGMASTAVVGSTAGVAVFVVLAASSADTHAIAGADVVRAGQLVIGAVVLLGIVGAVSNGVVRCVALAVGAGAAYGLVSVLVRDVAYAVQTKGFGALPVFSAVGVVVAFLAGSWFVQLAYSSGPPDVVVACQTVLNPLVATGLGVSMLGEIAGASDATVTALITTGLIAVVGVVLLARYHPEAVHRSTATTRAGLRRRAGRGLRTGKADA
ncbi:MAG: hypothetical protein GEU98_20140 [Pseudonocardiaceae bacterium]|nr:hypothetical protein [Pseudonocardiaceae bacterium]